MLILSRKIGESLIIDGRIIVKIVRVDGDVVKVGIQAPADIPVHREEVYEEIQKNNREALTQTRPVVPKFSRKPPAVKTETLETAPVPTEETSSTQPQPNL